MQLPDRDVPGYRDLAELLRELITTGALGPGDRVPSETDLRQKYDLARDTVRLAIAELRCEGLVVVRHGQPTRVRQKFDRQPIDPDGVEWIDVRMPNPSERRQLHIDDGVPIWLVKRSGVSEPEKLPADRWYLGPEVPND